LIYLNPRPREEDSSQFYTHTDYLPFASLTTNSRGSVTARLYELLRRINLRWKRRVITKFRQRADLPLANLQTPHLLDVGCGTGEFLATMKAAGWQVQGIERDDRAAAWAREQAQLPVLTGSSELLPTIDRQYDVVTLWHVLEHLYHPGEALAAIAKHLRENGWLLIAVPNIASIDARIYRSNWAALDAPRHLAQFSLETLGRLASKHGLTLRWWRQLPMDAFFTALMSERLGAARSSGKWFWWPLRLVRAILVAIASLIGGSHSPFTYAAYGASVICFFEKSHRQKQ
jgi:2-polyprenyl-3-methyl-5-hydroxy-6-metoxy-1,4-benzoquinol methylase